MDYDEIEQEIGIMQLSDSFFPTGLFATSNGLEFMFSEKTIQDASDLIKIIQINITQQIGPTDCVALAEVFDAVEDNNFEKIIEVDNATFATKSIKEIRDASIRSGIQLIKCVTEFVKDNKILNQYQGNILENNVRGIFPVAFGICCNALKIKKEKSMAMMLYGFSVSVVGAALRLGLIQHFEGQKIIHKIKPIIAQTIQENANRTLSDMWQFAPQMDIVQMSHEKMDSKMFIT